MNLDEVTVDDLTVDPHPILAAARAVGPVTWMPALGAWVVTSRSAAVEVMRDAQRFTVDDPRFSTAQVIGPSMLSTDGAEHARHRAPFTDWFADRTALSDLTEWMRSEAGRLIDDVRPNGQAELRNGLAAPLAAGTLVRMLGLDPPGSGALLDWYREIVGTVQAITAGADPGRAGAQAYRDLCDAIVAATDAGRATPLAQARVDLTDVDLAANAAVILFGGIETSEGATANAFWHLLTDPTLLETIRDDRSLLGAFVDESLRLEPAAANVDRYATVDTELHGVTVRAGDYVVVSLTGANRDPDAFPEPDSVQLDRPNGRQHTTFALGPHACLGIHIARAQTIAAIDVALDRLPDLRLIAETSTAPSGLVFRKPATLDATWNLA